MLQRPEALLLTYTPSHSEPLLQTVYLNGKSFHWQEEGKVEVLQYALRNRAGADFEWISLGTSVQSYNSYPSSLPLSTNITISIVPPGQRFAIC